VNPIVSGLTHLSGWVAYAVIGALVFGETDPADRRSFLDHRNFSRDPGS
jgi:hypothetical protein